MNDARSLPANEFERRLKAEVRRLQDDDGKPRLEQQKKASRFRSWVSRKTGMWCFRGELDPLSGVVADRRLQDELERLFREGAPHDCPGDPIEKQQYLAALVWLSLVLGNGQGSSGKPEVVVVVDATVLDDDGKPIVDWTFPSTCPTACWPTSWRGRRCDVVAILATSRLEPRTTTTPRQCRPAAGAAGPVSEVRDPRM